MGTLTDRLRDEAEIDLSGVEPINNNAQRGPRIIAQPAPEQPKPLKHPDEGKTGIRRSQHGSWMAIKDGRCVGVWSGAGSKLRAIRNAGTNTVLA